MTEAAYVGGVSAFLNAEKKGDTKAIRDASLGRVLGFDCYMDQNIRTHTQPIGDEVGALVGALSAGATAGTVSGITTAGTILAGDVFKVTGYDEWFVVSAAATASGGTVTISFSPAVKATTMAATSVVIFQKTHKANLAFHKNAFVLVTAPLACRWVELPDGLKPTITCPAVSSSITW
jgi:hypothetical protein